MATLDITYHNPKNTPRYNGGDAVGVWPAQDGASVQVDFTATAGKSAAVTARTLARVVPSAKCRIAVLKTGNATVANSRLIPADQEHAVELNRGEYISAITV